LLALISPFYWVLLQKMKLHPFVSSLLEGGERVAYGGRTLNEGGLQSIPKIHFPGGALVGCSAGFVNVPKIKGTHNAMKSGMLAAEAAFDAIHKPQTLSVVDNASTEAPLSMEHYEDSLKASWVWKELLEVRNIRPSFNTPLGIWGGMAYSGIDMLLKGRTPWTFRNTISDSARTKRARLVTFHLI
jgi:electron-transferring-flavoprotein dehydrogenase